jgi:tRNA pseudouridine38-40 synthase
LLESPVHWARATLSRLQFVCHFMPRYALAVEYDGSDFQGWQVQPKGPTLQGALESALSKVANSPITVICAGRTDAGVHATGQIVHFDAPVERTNRAWTLGANANLPAAMSVSWCQTVAPDFHARYSALARKYQYRLINRAARPALLRRTLSWERQKLSLAPMQQGALQLLGEHDFSSFRTVACQAKSPYRRLDMLNIQQDGDSFIFDVQANAFLHHMVRNLVGSLLVVGRGEAAPEWIGKVLAAQDRTLAGATAPPEGLVFVGPQYPAACALPAAWTAERALEDWVPPHARFGLGQSP